MRLLLLLFAAVLVGLVGVYPFVDDGAGFVGGLPTPVVVVVGGQTLLVVLHVAMARRIRARAATTPDRATTPAEADR